MKTTERIRIVGQRLSAFGAVLFAVVFPLCLNATELPERDWGRIDLDDDHTTIEAADKSRQNSAIPADTAGDLIVPSTLRGYKVVSIGKRAFYGCAQLTSVAIPEGVTNIADEAFYGCSSLTNVVFPSTLKSIGASAFIGCQKLGRIDIEVPRLTIGDRAFRNCDGLQAIRFVGDALNVGTRAFFGCGGLRDVNLIVKDIILSERVFSGGYDDLPTRYDLQPTSYGYCDQLTNVIVAASNRVEFGGLVFVGCSALKQVTLTAGSELSVGPTAFSGCTTLQSVMLTAGSRMQVGASAFSDWLEILEFGSSLVRHMEISHSSCNNLTNLLMAASNRVELGSSVFSGCAALQTVTLFAGESMSVGALAFSSCMALQQAALVASETSSFGDSVFSNCWTLQEIELPEGLADVPQNAFYCCSSLQSISLSSNVVSIAYRAFDTCTSLRSVELAEGLQTIEAQAFYGCSDLEDLCVPQSVSKVGDRAFERCDGLGRIVFSEGDTNTPSATSVSVGERAFYRNGSLTNVVLSQTVTDLGVRAFAECGLLTTVNLPTNLIEVSESLFEFCERLSAIDLPPGLTTIGSSAFNACSSLTTFAIPTRNVVSLGSKAFYGTKYWNDWPDDSLVENNGYILGFKGNPTSVALPENCKAIPNGMFEGMTTLTNVTVPAGLEKVGSRSFAGSGVVSIDLSKTKVSTLGASAFDGCASLHSATLAPSVTAIPDDAFRNCSALVSMDIPVKVASIGASAFRDCVSLVSVSGGAGVRSVGDYAFAGCVSLQPFRFGEDVAYGEHVFRFVEWTENVLFPSVGTMAQEYPQTYADIKSVVISSTLTGIVDRACFGCAALESVVIPDGVVGVGASAFEGCIALSSVVLPASVSNVGSNAFMGCGAVTSLTTPGNFVVREVFPDAYVKLREVNVLSNSTQICDHMMENCSGVTSLALPISLAEIGAYAFSGCTGLGDLVLPTSLQSIGVSAFSGCTSMTSIDVPEGVSIIDVEAFGDCTALSNVLIRGLSTSVGSNAFARCESVRSVRMPIDAPLSRIFPAAYGLISDVTFLDGVTDIPDSAFAGCEALTGLDIPSTVTAIGASAFSGCTGLGDVVLPEELGSIGDYAFMNCTNLKFVKFMGPQPTANPNIYFETKGTLVSGVRKKYEESWTTEVSSPAEDEPEETENSSDDDSRTATNSVAVSRALPVRWPSPANNVSSRRIAWWDGPAGGESERNSITFYYYDTTGGKETCGPGLWLEEPPNGREGYDFLGWFTKPYGGILVTEDNYMELGVTKVYAHWVRNRDDHDDPQEWGDVLYDANKTHVYDGYLLDGDQVAGTIQLSLAKGKYDREEETASVKLTAKILVLGEGKTLSLKGNAEDVGEDGGYGILAKGDREAEIEFTPNELSGSFEGLDIVGVRNMFGETTDWDKRTARAALDDCTDPCSVVLQADGDSPFACGYVALSVTFSSKGKAKIAGTMPDGTKVSASPQLLVFEDRCVLPVVVPLYSGKKGGFGFSITYPKVEGADAIVPYVAELTSWVANPGKTSEFVSDLIEVGIGRTGNIAASAAFSVTDSFDVDGAVVDDSLLPAGVEVIVSGTKWKLPKADTVKFLRDEEAYEIVRDYGNPAGLKLTYAAKTGTFKGSFKVYAVTDAGKSKKHTATVNGAVLDGVGYGTAVIKKVGAVSVVIE